jgi:EAL domain
VPSGWFSVTTLIARSSGSGSLNPWPAVVDQTTMSTPGVSHPSPTTVDDFGRVLDERAVRGDLVPPLTLFVNVELVSLGVACPDDLRPAIELGKDRLRVVVQVTERAVAGDPAQLLATVAQARQAGWGVALDDVGAAPAGLAVLPFTRPDVIKLDMRLLQGRTTTEAGHIVNTVRAERTDAVVIAEASRRSSTPARPWPPGPPSAKGSCSAIPPRCPRSCRRRGRPSRCGRRRPRPGGHPWEVVVAAREPRRAGKDLVAEMCMQLEHQGLDAAEPNLLLACFQDAPTSSPRPPGAGTSSWPPGRRSPAPSATTCRSPRWPGSGAPTRPPTTRCARSGS